MGSWPNLLHPVLAYKIGNFWAGMKNKHSQDWVRKVAKVDCNQYNFEEIQRKDVYREVKRLLDPDPPKDTWPWMHACFKAFIMSMQDQN